MKPEIPSIDNFFRIERQFLPDRECTFTATSTTFTNSKDGKQRDGETITLNHSNCEIRVNSLFRKEQIHSRDSKIGGKKINEIQLFHRVLNRKFDANFKFLK